jgi:ABC-type multidrug transport system ATPase subunit
LTVQQTLEFALSTKTPRKMLEGVTPADFRKRVLDVLLKMLNISHTRNTMVGSE